MTIFVTGGAGFIGANFILDWLNLSEENVITLDALTYAGHPQNLSSLRDDPRLIFAEGDINDQTLVNDLLATYRPRAILNFAAESHVDRSIEGPAPFVSTNLVGTFRLLEAARNFCQLLPPVEAAKFRFLHVSTDEVYGTLTADEAPFTENSKYAPNSPYSASKAGSDHLVRAWFHTFGLPVLTTNCTNNYGPRQFPEKFIPVVIESALRYAPVPIYGRGDNVRDWIHVSDHCSGIRAVLANGQPGQSYNLSSECELSNLTLATAICDIVDELVPAAGDRRRRDLLSYVKDRAGHDFRYSMSARKTREELGWKPEIQLEQGLRSTVRWYIDNAEWLAVARQRLKERTGASS